VWIGMGDPNPKIDWAGGKYLLAKGINVHHFDEDLREIVEAENADWAKWIREQSLAGDAAAVAARPAPVALAAVPVRSPAAAADDSAALLARPFEGATIGHL
jgi:hypothetical protein